MSEKIHKLVAQVTILSRNPFSGDEDVKDLSLCMQSGEDVAQMKVMECGELEKKDAIEELQDMGKPASALGLDAP